MSTRIEGLSKESCGQLVLLHLVQIGFVIPGLVFRERVIDLLIPFMEGLDVLFVDLLIHNDIIAQRVAYVN